MSPRLLCRCRDKFIIKILYSRIDEKVLPGEKMENKEIIPVREKSTNSIEELLVNQNFISPLVNIYETDNEFILIASMPGVERKDIKVRVEKDSLILFGQIDYDNHIDRNYILNEQEIGNFYRTFKISNSVDQNKIEAKFDNGQLTVTLPKYERIKPRTIDIL